MVVLTLRRRAPLTAAEARRLPPGCYPVMSTADVIARAELDLPPAHLARFAAELARSVPDAEFMAEERPNGQAVALVQPGQLRRPYLAILPAASRQPLPSPDYLANTPAEPGDPFDPSDEEGWEEREEGEEEGEEPEEGEEEAEEEREEPEEEEAPLPALDPWAAVQEGGIDAADDAFRGYILSEDEEARLLGLLDGDHPPSLALGCRIARLTRAAIAAAPMRRLLFYGDPAVRIEAIGALALLAAGSIEPSLHILSLDADPAVSGAARAALARARGGRT